MRPVESGHLQRYPPLAEFTETVLGDNQTWHAGIKQMLAPGGVQFVGEVYIGHNLSEYLLLFDTGSDMPWVTHKDSKSLMNDSSFPKKGFACRDSPTCSIDYEHLQLHGFQYGKGSTVGVICTDRLAIMKDAVVENVQFMLALEGKGTLPLT